MPSTGFNPSSNWMGRWQNFAVLSPWKDSPTGNLVGPTRTVTEQLYASKTYVNASKFPWSEEPVPSDSTDLRPFKYFGGPTWSGTQTIGGYPWSYRQPDGSRALQFPTQGDWANPLSGYWQGGGTITDLLQPPQRATGGTEGHPLSMMPQMTGAGSLFRGTCAGFPASDISCLTGNGSSTSEYLNTTDPNNWAARSLAGSISAFTPVNSAAARFSSTTRPRPSRPAPLSSASARSAGSAPASSKTRCAQRCSVLRLKSRTGRTNASAISAAPAPPPSPACWSAPGPALSLIHISEPTRPY